jgi:hypothetical protein
MAMAKADLRSEERAPAVQRDASVPQGDTYRDTGALHIQRVREREREREEQRREEKRQADRETETSPSQEAERREQDRAKKTRDETEDCFEADRERGTAPQSAHSLQV